ncbi:MAG: HipA N-terminal domain-containing protein [Alphaproteobacteria bacterium]|nr:HipA N-terminal domain-containing protein [Alphaproteobacteria bacterium]
MMPFYPEFSPENIVGVDVFLERFQTRVYAGKLEKAKGQFHFCYDNAYLKMKNILSLGPEFPLTRQDFYSAQLFPSFQDRLPDPDNPAYADYCAASGITVATTDPIVLLPTIGKRGPSSFIFEPIYKETFSYADCEKFREKMGLSMQDFALLFDVSLSILQKIKAGEASGKDVLKRLEVYARSFEMLLLQINRASKWLHYNKVQGMMLNLLEYNLNLLDGQVLTLKKAEKLVAEAINYYWQITDTTDKEFKRKKGIFNTEVIPALKIARYLSSIGEESRGLQFYLKNKDIPYDGKFLWGENKETCIELTRALGGDNGGKNEHLKQENLKLKGAGPLNFDFVKAGIKHPNQLLNNSNIALVSGVFEEQERTLERLQLAFNKKQYDSNENLELKYKGFWLIITLPGTFVDDQFHQRCDLFWKEVDKEKCIFDRVFVISEEFVNCGETDIVTLVVDTGEVYTKKRDPQKAIWDSGLIST